MELVNKVREGCNVAVDIIEGNYGWASETVMILLIVLIFNFAAKWLLRRLHYKYEKQKKFWHDSFVSALYKPLSVYVWFFAGVQFLDLIDRYTLTKISPEKHHLVLGLGAIGALTWFLLRWKNYAISILTMQSYNHEIAYDVKKLDVVNKIFTLSIIAVATLLTLEVTHSNFNTLIAFGGIGGLTIAFASQEMVSNFFGGFMVYVTQPFSQGDWIQIPDKKIEGTVEEIGWYMTRIRGADKKPQYVPNSTFPKNVLVNASRVTHRQFAETIRLRYSDLPLLPNIISEIKSVFEKYSQLDHSYPIIIHFATFGTYSLEIQISALSLVLDNEEFSRIKDDLLIKMGEIIAKHGAEIAVPTSIVHLSDSSILVPART